MSGKREETPQLGDFVVGQDRFEDLEVRPAVTKDLHHVFDKARNLPVRQFVLLAKKQVTYLCGVTLVEKRERLTPRLEFSIRDETGRLTGDVSALSQFDSRCRPAYLRRTLLTRKVYRGAEGLRSSRLLNKSGPASLKEKRWGPGLKPILISWAVYAALKRRSCTKPQRLKPGVFEWGFVARPEVVPFPFVRRRVFLGVANKSQRQRQRTGVSAPQGHGSFSHCGNTPTFSFNSLAFEFSFQSNRNRGRHLASFWRIRCILFLGRKNEEGEGEDYRGSEEQGSEGAEGEDY
jgi:hypothetical protein